MAIEQKLNGPVKGGYRFALLDLLLQLGQCLRRQILVKGIPMVNRRLFSGIADTKQFLDLMIESLVILLLGNELFQILIAVRIEETQASEVTFNTQLLWGYGQ